MILTSSYSRIAAEHRAWLIDPTGKTYPCGSDHHECIFLYPEIAALTDKGSDDLVEKGWAKAGAFFAQKFLYFDVGTLTDAYLRAFQGLANMNGIKDNFNVDLTTNSGSMNFPYKDFKNFRSVTELNKFYRSSRYGSTYGDADDRTWLIDHSGKVYPCGYSHADCFDMYSEVSDSIDEGSYGRGEGLISEGWAKAGLSPETNQLYFEVGFLNDFALGCFQKLAESVGVKDNFYVDLSTVSQSMRFPYKNFKNFRSVAELNKFYRSSRYGSSRPPDRAWMLSPEGELYPCGQQHEECQEHHEIFRGRPLYQFMREGWTKLGAFSNGTIYLNADTLTNTSLQVLQTLAHKLKFKDQYQVQIVTPGDTDIYDYGVFKKFENLEDITKYRKYLS